MGKLLTKHKIKHPGLSANSVFVLFPNNKFIITGSLSTVLYIVFENKNISRKQTTANNRTQPITMNQLDL